VAEERRRHLLIWVFLRAVTHYFLDYLVFLHLNAFDHGFSSLLLRHKAFRGLVEFANSIPERNRLARPSNRNGDGNMHSPASRLSIVHGALHALQ